MNRIYLIAVVLITLSSIPYELLAQPASLQRTYAGYIREKSGTKQYGIQMDLTAAGAALSGTYSYNSQKTPIRISGSIDWTSATAAGYFEHGTLTLLEYNEKGVVNGFFRGVFDGNAITGTWSTPDGKRLLPFQLAEVGTVARPGLPDRKEKPEPKAVYEAPAKPEPVWPATAKCEEREIPNSDGMEPSIERTCLFQDFKTHSVGEPDYKGRYSYSYTLYRKESGKYIQVSNATLFREDRLKELELILNRRIRADYMEMKKDADDCYEGFVLPEFLVNQMGIYFRDDQIFFSVSFGLSSACLAVDGTLVSLSISELKPFLTNR